MQQRSLVRALWAAVGVLAFASLAGLGSVQKNLAVAKVIAAQPAAAAAATGTTVKALAPPQSAPTTTVPPSTAKPTTTAKATTTARPTTTAKPEPTPQERLAAWAAKSGSAFTALPDSLSAVGNAAEDLDPEALSAACGDLVRAVGVAQRTLPTPDSVLTGLLRNALSSYGAAGRDCKKGADTFDPSLLRRANTELEAGTGYIEQATDRLTELGADGLGS